MSTRPVPVPETCEWWYAVMTPQPLDHVDHVPLPDDALLRAHGTSALAIARLQRCPHQVLLQSSTVPRAAAAAARDTRIQALELADRHDGVVVELHTPRVLELRADEVSLAHAAQWYVLDHSSVLSGDLLTDGLAQFGLPEVRVRAAAGAGTDDVGRAMSSAVLAGVVHRLIEDWPAHDPVGRATVTLRDIAFGLGDAQADLTPRDRGLEIDLDYVPDDHVLEVTFLQDAGTTLFV